MRILSIDPGPETSAWLLWNGRAEQFDGECPNEKLLETIHGGLLYDVLVIEKVACMGMAVGAEVFETVFWSGRFAQIAEANGKPWHRIKRHEVKMHLCGNMQAKDANIRCALIDKLGKPGVKKSPGPTYGVSGHLWAALSVAVTWQEKHGVKPEEILK